VHDPDLILVVEDQEPDQYIARRNLSRQWPNATIKVAFDGEEAIDYLQSGLEKLPDLLLLDINMPRMNGHEFLEFWSKQNRGIIPMVVLLTSSDQELDKQRAMKYPFVKDYMLKPLDKSTVASLNGILRREDMQDDDAAQA